MTPGRIPASAPPRSRSRSRTKGRAALLALTFAALGLGASTWAATLAQTRTISLHNIHTNETLTIEYKRDGKFLPDAMTKINWVLRDWRQNEPTTMDPALIDLLWQVHEELGSKMPIEVICGYRSRSTNEMLRRTVGGQASESRHILGKAADVYFPDVKLADLRYAGLLHEQGGVGYYPTSGTPFVHLDTDRVRAWPRLPRLELALLFPSTHTRHMPADGGPITADDVRTARSKYASLAVHVASLLTGGGAATTAVQVASSDGAQPVTRQPSATLAAATSKPASAGMRLALAELPAEPAFAPQTQPRLIQVSAPQLLSEPRLIDRPSRLSTQKFGATDRAGLAALSSQIAATDPELIRAPTLASRPARATPASMPSTTMPSLTGPSLTGAPSRAQSALQQPPRAQVAAIDPSQLTGVPTLSDAPQPGWAAGWAESASFDEDHPEDMAYHPFPLGPFLTATASPDDAALIQMVHPDVQATFELLDSAGSMPPMRLRPGLQEAKVLWAQEFRGEAVDLTAIEGREPELSGAPKLADRRVRTSGG